jgi:hypothetical protein
MRYLKRQAHLSLYAVIVTLLEDSSHPHCADQLIEKLGNIPRKERCGPRAPEALLLRQEINDLILTASLQVDGFLAEIDSETGKIREAHDELSDRRDSAVSWSTLFSAIGTGGGAAGSSLALVRKTATAGNWVSAIAGGVGTIFGFAGWYQQLRGPRGCFPDIKDKHCHVPLPSDSETAPCSPTMLFHLVFPGRPDASCHSDYDPSIDSYLNSRWRAELVGQWLANPSNGPPLHKAEELEVEEPYLFANRENPRKVSIDDLTDRANKLSDLRSVVGRMNRDLSRLTENLAEELQCPDSP